VYGFDKFGCTYRTNIWAYKGLAGFGKGRDADLDAHSTVKNVAMIADALLDFSNRGDLVLDPTAGSGTTLLAAHRTKRRGAAIEIDGHYCDVALGRLARATGLPVAHADGRDFDTIATERAEARDSEQGRAGRILGGWA
jgi:DNA modification methylase